jgi:hypothetical protein
MTREGEIIVLREHLSTCQLLARRLHEVRALLEARMPINAAAVRELESASHIYVLGFLKTFEQFEEALARTLKTIAMLLQFGRIERMTARDVALRAVSLGIILDGKAWADAVRVRNALAHEYPLNPGKQAEQVNAAWEHSATLFRTVDEIEQFVERERLLLGDI